VEDIYRLYPYENFLYVLWLTGEEVKNYLEFSYDKWLSLYSHPEMGGYADSAAGIVYKVHADKPKGGRVDILRMADGTTFELDKYYRVALNSYRALGGGGFITEGAGIGYDELAQRVVTMETADLRFQMINYIEMRKEISPQALNQWEFVK
jgi:2',3'-cyclic-nucleotide 2'-phosphodiesterase/3'-nucleotidase